jgi:hypothetical protein
MKDRASHRAFTVVGHPVNRAFSAFGGALAGSEDIRRAIVTEAGMAEADLRAGKLGSLSTEVRHDLFLAFLRLVRLTIEGRTRLKLPPDWASQSEHIAGFSSFRAPDLIVRAEQAAEMLARLAADCKAVGPRVAPALSDPSLAEIMDASVDAAAQAAYGRDYANFGFGAWSPQAA